MQQVGIQRLVADRVIAVKGGQTLTRSGAGNVLIPLVVKQISNVQRAAGAQYIRQLSEELVIILNLQNRYQVLGLQSQDCLYLVDAGSSGPEATGIIGAVQNEGRI